MLRRRDARDRRRRKRRRAAGPAGHARRRAHRPGARRARQGRPLDGRPQPEAGVTYAAKITQGRGDDRLARAGGRDRAPPARLRSGARGAGACWPARRSPAGAASSARAAARPGEVVAVDGGALTVACGEGRLALTELQRAGGRRMAAEALLRGWTPAGRRRLRPGARSPARPRRSIELCRAAAIFAGDAFDASNLRGPSNVQSAQDRRPDGGDHRAVHGHRRLRRRPAGNDARAHRRGRPQLLQLLVLRQAGAEDVQRARGRRELGAAVPFDDRRARAEGRPADAARLRHRRGGAERVRHRAQSRARRRRRDHRDHAGADRRASCAP